MKHPCSIFLLLILPMYSLVFCRTAALTGTVVDKLNGKPVENARVRVIGNNDFDETLTNADGEFSLAGTGTAINLPLRRGAAPAQIFVRNEKLWIRSAPDGQPVYGALHDLTGMRISEISLTGPAAGLHAEQITPLSPPSGSYVIVLRGKGGRSIRKLLFANGRVYAGSARATQFSESAPPLSARQQAGDCTLEISKEHYVSQMLPAATCMGDA
ncbi:MAG: hypothetical protein GF350_02300, partial [Chitinivibrionales bacterium]|nr:hypothetical protein [Chitinivibrionales bacterium]